MPEITKYAQGTPSWVELSTTEDTEALKFYGSLFGWVDDPQEMGPGSIYHMQQLGGLPAAAIYKMGDEEKIQNVPPHWKTYFTVTSSDETAEQAKEKGGSVLAGPFDVFTAGRMALLKDPQGAVFAIWEPNEHIGSRVKDDPGAFTWNELLTSDSKAALTFYSALFGVETPTLSDPMPYNMLRVDGKNVAGVRDITGEMGPIPPHWGVYFATNDVDESLKQAISLGGKVLFGPLDVPTVGRFAVLQDPQGASFSVFKVLQSHHR